MKAMQYFTSFWWACLCLWAVACQPKSTSENKAQTDEANTKPTQTIKDSSQSKTDDAPKPMSKVEGYYTGVFEPTNFDSENDVYHANKITISIDSLDKTQQWLYGHSIVAGNKRPFKGTYQLTDSGYVAKVKEPGDNRYDGQFRFTIKPDQQSLSGTWEAFRKDFSATATRYVLKRKTFKYEPSLGLPPGVEWAALYNHALMMGHTRKGERLSGDVVKLNASAKALKKEEVANLYRGDLEVIRNAIYARHGYSFKNRKMRFVFDHIDWYMPISIDVRNELTDLEKKNIDLLKRYENHAARYYDVFGR